MRWVRRIVALALVAAVLVGGWKFAAQNAGEITIDYLFGEWIGVAVWQALVGAFAAGAVVSAVVGLLTNTRLRLVARRYRRTVHGLESEVHQLRNLPLQMDAEQEPEEEDALRSDAREAAQGRGT